MKGAGTRESAVVLLPAFALQLLCKSRDWWGAPVALVAEASPDAPLLAITREARRAGLRPGLRQGPARNLVPGLRTGVVRHEDREAVLGELVAALQTFSPRVARWAPAHPSGEGAEGSFRLDPTGLGGLYGGERNWAETVHRYLRGRGFRATVGVGFHAASLHAAALAAGRPVQVSASEEAEREAAADVQLRALGVPERLCAPLERLGVMTLGELLALPHGELTQRFGAEASALHDAYAAPGSPGARGGQLPLQPAELVAPRRIAEELDPPSAHLDRLLFAAKRGLDPLLAELSEAGETARSLLVELQLESASGAGEPRELVLEPAEATLDAGTWLELLRLKLARLALPRPVERLVLEAEAAPAEGTQLEVASGEAPPRDVAAAGRALARLRASLGADAVLAPTVASAHLPEARSRWRPTREVKRPGEVAAEGPVPLQRRFLRPRAVGNARDGGPRLPGSEGAVVLRGPQRVSGGWWGFAPPDDERGDAREVGRDYYYAETASGGLHLVYYDVARDRWFTQGAVD